MYSKIDVPLMIYDEPELFAVKNFEIPTLAPVSTFGSQDDPEANRLRDRREIALEFSTSYTQLRNPISLNP